MPVRLLFPTRLFESEIGDPSLVSDLEAACWMLEDGDEAGRRWCEEQGYDGYASYASLDVPPRAGLVLMWESWLRHEVMPNRAEDARISISFNYALA